MSLEPLSNSGLASLIGAGATGNVATLQADGSVAWEEAASGGASASGASGAIQLSDGASGLTAEPTLLFWNPTTNRLGVGTNTQTNRVQIKSEGTSTTPLVITNSAGLSRLVFGMTSNESGEILIKDNGGTTDVAITTAHASYFNGHQVKFGIGTNDPKVTFHAVGGNAEGTPSLPLGANFVLQNNSVSSDNMQTHLISGTAGKCILAFGDAISSHRGGIDYDVSSNSMRFNVSSSSSEAARFTSSKTLQLSGALMLNNAAVAGTITPTHTVIIQDLTGTSYKIPVVAA